MHDLCFNYTLGIVEIDVSATPNAIPLPLAVLQSWCSALKGCEKLFVANAM